MCALNIFCGGFACYIGYARNIKSFRSIHSFYLSVRRFDPPAISCSDLKVLITTATKRLRKKKLPTIMKTMKNMTHAGFLYFGSGT
jgi:hypothetical protein